MCSGRGMYPPYGIPIPVEVHERYSEEVKLAWYAKEVAEKEDRRVGVVGANPEKA